MSTAAVMLVKDEEDIIRYTVEYLLGQVDEIIVADNLSTDSTHTILVALRQENPRRIILTRDNDPGYRQDAKTSALAQVALRRGHEWVVPCDADERWYSPFGRLADVFAGISSGAMFARAIMLNHIPTALDDPADPNPYTRIAWRFEAPGALQKVACRLDPTLRIDMGNHDAEARGVRSGPGAFDHVRYGTLFVRHFSWRTPEQYLQKVANGSTGYAAAPELDPGYGGHWKMFGLPGDAGFDRRVMAHFNKWFWSSDPERHPELVRDPAP